MSIEKWILIIFGSIILYDIYCLVDLKHNIKHQILYYRNLTIQDYRILEDTITSMNGREFEIFCAKLFKLLGYDKIHLTKCTNDKGRDIIIEKDNTKSFVECKAWNKDKSLIGREVLQKLIGSCLMDTNVHHCIVITTSKYNQNAFDYANIINNNKIYYIDLWDIDDIMIKIQHLNTTKVLEIAGITKNIYQQQIEN